MNFPDDFIDEVKARINVSEIVGRHVKLRRKGREFEALSPFTNEKTASFFVNDEKGFYHCFSSGKHGDAIQFLIEVEGCSFVDAVKSLAETAGMELPKKDPETERRFARQRSLIDVMDMAVVFFERIFHRDEGEVARTYITGRGVPLGKCRDFRIGFAPPANAGSLMDHLAQAGVTPDQMLDCGLVIKSEHDGRIFDRFRGRLMFPITDSRGRNIAFGGRGGLMGKDKAKYMNSPATDLFDKSGVVYNIKNAKQSLADPYNADRGLIVVEGYMDVVALSAHGIDHAVAPMGTALTPRQMSLMWQAGPEPVLCFDGDSAGQRAAARAIENVLPILSPGKSIRIARMPAGKDPDDIVNSDGPDALKAILSRAVSLSNALWRHECDSQPYDTPEGMAGLKNNVLERVDTIKDEAVRELYRRDMLSRIDGLYKRRNTPASIGRNHKASIERSTAYDKSERRLITAIFEWPDLLDMIMEDFFVIKFKTPEYHDIQKDILSLVREGEPWIPSEYFVDIPNENKAAIRDMSKAKAITLMDFMGSYNSDLDMIKSSWMEYYSSFQNKNEPLSKSLNDELDEAILAGDRARVDELNDMKRRA